MDQKNLLQFLKKSLSYILVAAVASAITWFLADKTPNSKLEQLANVIDRKFIGQADQTAIQDAAADAMVEALGDRWSYYVPADQQDYYEKRRNNAYVGIGVSVMKRADGRGYDIMAVTSGGPAEEAGILAGDIITHADGTAVGDLEVTQVQELIMGEKNTRVVLKLLRGEQILELSVTRRTIQTRVAEGRMLSDNIGLVTIQNFFDHSGEESIGAVEDLLAQGAEKLIFDVRNNPGGYVDEMVQILDHLLPEGQLQRKGICGGIGWVLRGGAHGGDLQRQHLLRGRVLRGGPFGI